MTDFQRIEEIKKYLGLSYNKMATAMDFPSPQVFYDIKAGKCGISYDTAKKIQEYFKNSSREINFNWLLTGEGEMLRVDATSSGTEGKEGVVMVPLLNLDARGGLSGNEVTDTAEFVSGQIPFGADLARKGDFAMMITGDSMYPRYPSGSYILLREIPMWREYLELSVPYLLELQDERRVAKIVCKGADREHYVLKSVNPDFEDTEISVSFIRRVFQVVAMLKKEIV